MIFEIEPYNGAAPLCLGMGGSEIQKIFGMPVRAGKNRWGESILYFSDFQVNLGSDDRLVEITFYPSIELLYRGVSVFYCKGIPCLRSLDSDMLEFVGILLLPNIGITASGLHGEEEKTVTVLARGRIDHLVSKFREI